MCFHCMLLHPYVRVKKHSTETHNTIFLVGQRVGWKFPQLYYSSQKLCQSTFSILKLTQHNVSRKTEILRHNTIRWKKERFELETFTLIIYR